MTRQLAMEGRDAGIRVNSASPGVIQTLRTASHMKNGNWSGTMMRKIMLDLGNQRRKSRWQASSHPARPPTSQPQMLRLMAG